MLNQDRLLTQTHDYRLRDDVDINAAAPAPSVQWYTTALPRAVLKALARRDDLRAGQNYALWLLLLLVSGALAYSSWGSWWAFPAFALYGVIYSSSDSRWHELSHGTPFKTAWINESLYHLCSLMTLREGIRWRWSHARHHSHTVLVGLDPEIHATRPPNLFFLLLGWTYMRAGWMELCVLIEHATGRINRDAALYVPRSQWPAMVLSSRLYLLVIVVAGAVCLAYDSVLPAMFIALPRFYGGFLHFTQAITQHIGLAEDVFDHRQNARTVLMNPVFSFLYSNMNYHVEHHMYPMVPFYRLPELHKLVRHDCPAPYANLRSVYREMIPAPIRQRREPAYFIQRPLPAASTTR